MHTMCASLNTHCPQNQHLFGPENSIPRYWIRRGQIDAGPEKQRLEGELLMISLGSGFVTRIFQESRFVGNVQGIVSASLSTKCQHQDYYTFGCCTFARCDTMASKVQSLATKRQPCPPEQNFTTVNLFRKKNTPTRVSRCHAN